MIISEYKIQRRPTHHDSNIEEWVITLWLTPTWFENHVMGKFFPEKRVLIGSCSDWHWSDQKPAGYFWKWWAFSVTKKHDKSSKGATYVNRRFNRSKDK